MKRSLWRFLGEAEWRKEGNEVVVYLLRWDWEVLTVWAPMEIAFVWFNNFKTSWEF